MVRLAASLLFLAAVAVGRKRLDREDDDGEDVRRAIPGEPGRDYPTLAAVPATSFQCSSEGFFADAETGCQAFHICSLQRGLMGRQSFLCPNGTIFNTRVNTCDWWNRVRCDGSAGVNTGADISKVYAGSKAPHEASSRAKVSSGRRKQPESYDKLSSVAPNNNFNNVETRNNPLVQYKGSVQVINRDNDLDVVDYNNHLSNSISTEGYHQTTEGLRKVLGTKGYSIADNNRVTEVTIKPRVRYTYNLKSSSDNPLYSLNPLIHLARDASLLSTFTDPSLKVTHPVERYVVNDVLPQYKNRQEATTTNDPLTTSTEEPEYKDDDPIIFPENNPNDNTDPIYFPESVSPSLGDVVKNFFESNGVPQGSVIGGQDEVGPTLSSVQPNGLSNDEENRNENLPEIGSSYLTPNRNNTSSDNYLNVVRVSSGYSFAPTANFGYNPQTVKVTNSFSVGDIFSTEGPEIRNSTNLPPNLFGVMQNTTNNLILQKVDTFGNRDISNDALPFNPQNLPSDGRKPMDNNRGDYNVPDPYNDTNVQFINRFIVDEPSSPSPDTNSYNLNSFDTNIYTTPSYTSQPVSSNYLPSSSSSEGNLLSGIPKWIKEGAVTQPPTDVINYPASISGYNGNVLNTTPKTNIIPYNNIPGHYITKSPQESHRATFNAQYSQTRKLKMENIPFARPIQQESKTFSSTPTVAFIQENQDKVRNIYSNKQIPQETFGIPTMSYGSDGDGFIQGYGQFSTEVPPPLLQNYLQKSVQRDQQNFRYTPGQFQASLPGNGNVLSTDKSVEIVNEKEKENIFSGLQIANVLPSVEAHSWTTIITPPTTTEGKLLSPTNSERNPSPSPTPSTVFSDNYNRQSPFTKGVFTTLSPPSLSSSRATSASPLVQSSKSLPSPSLRNFSSIYDSGTNYPSPTTGKTTATFLNNNEEVSLYTVPNRNEMLAPVENYATLNNVVRPSQDFSTQRNTVEQTTILNKDLPTAKTSFVQDNGLNKHSLTTDEISSLAFSTPKPFVESHSLYVAPQQHSTILPDYREAGKQLLNPADLLRINSLHNSAELEKNVNVGSAEVVKSISFSFDSAEDIRQFEFAKAKGLFSLK